MSKGGSKQTTTQQQTQSTSLDPRFGDAVYGNYQQAQDLAKQPYQPYTGNYLDQAAQQVGQAQNVDPISYVPSMQTQTVMGPASQASASQGYENIDKYMNPYLNDVVGAAQQDGERARQMARMTTEGQATAAGAFGGSRHGVADALTDSESLRNLNSLTANLRNTGWNTALGASIGDADRNTGVSQFNAGANNQVASQNAAMEAQRAGINYGALNDAARFNIGTNQAAQGQNQQAALARAGMLGQIGSQDYGQYQDAQQRPLTMQQLINQSLGLVPQTGTTTGSGTGTTTQTSSAGFLGNLGTALKIGGQVAAFSDRRLKSDIRTEGYDTAGRRLVSYRYIWDDPGVRQNGVIAQEVAISDPHAVREFGGFLMVDYSKLSEAA